jgi:type II secretory pathway predicted ATPase ExeA
MIKEQIISAIKESYNCYHRLILVVGKSGEGKTTILKELHDEIKIPYINVNLELSRHLLDLSNRQRKLKVFECMLKLIDQKDPVTLLDNTEILFDVNLEQDPLKLLQLLSRDQCIIAAWNGEISGKMLTYAKQGHQEYRIYELNDEMVFSLNENRKSL